MTCRADFQGTEHEKSYKQNVNQSHHVVILRRKWMLRTGISKCSLDAPWTDFIGFWQYFGTSCTARRHRAAAAAAAYTNFLSRLFAGQYSAYSSQVQPALLRQHSSVIEGLGPRRRCRLRSLRNTRASTTLRNGYSAKHPNRNKSKTSFV